MPYKNNKNYRRNKIIIRKLGLINQRIFKSPLFTPIKNKSGEYIYEKNINKNNHINITI